MWFSPCGSVRVGRMAVHVIVSVAIGHPPIIRSIATPPVRKNRTIKAAARTPKTMFSQVV
jgi:hypothetical protein